MARAAANSQHSYTTLDANQPIETFERLYRRIGKRFPNAGLYHVAHRFIQKSDDSVVLNSANELGSQTTDLSLKIWQKLMILHGHSHSQLVYEPEKPV